MKNKTLLVTPATRSAAVVFGVYLSAQAAFRLDLA
jgi:hypothetical protein